jgi:integral membrane protein 2B
MTIYTSKPTDKKDEKGNYVTQVYTDALPEKGDNQHNEETTISGLPPTYVTMNLPRRRKNNCANICVLLTALVVLATGILGGIYLYKHLAHRTFQGWCGVRYYEYQDDYVDSPEARGHKGSRHHRQKSYGQFEEQVEIDKVDGKFEKLTVPEFDDCKKATVLHDFEKNLTSIVDKDHFRCFVMPLNRTLVKPPKDFWDMLSKLSSGYYMPDVEVVRERYRVLHPPIHNLSPFGYYIWKECHRFDTYRLEKVGPHEPVAMVKRDTDQKEKLTFYVGGSANQHLNKDDHLIERKIEILAY